MALAIEPGFPDVRWGSETSPIRKPLVALTATTAGSWLLRRLVPVDRALLVRSRGRYTVLGPFGIPLLLLTTTGSRTGLPRTTPLVYVRDGDRLLVTGSNFGQERHPAWSENLVADPAGTVTIGGTDVAVRATLLQGEERDRAWRRFTDLARTYSAYEARTTRHLRVFALERVAGP